MKKELLIRELEGILRVKFPDKQSEYQMLLNELYELNGEGKIKSADDIELFVHSRLTVTDENTVIDNETGEIIEDDRFREKNSFVMYLQWCKTFIGINDIAVIHEIFKGMVEAVETWNYHLHLENPMADIVLQTMLPAMEDNANEWRRRKLISSEAGKKSAEMRKTGKEG